VLARRGSHTASTKDWAAYCALGVDVNPNAQDLTAPKVEDDKGVENLKAHGDECVNQSAAQVCEVVADEGGPFLPRPRGSRAGRYLATVLGDT